jgi:mono/diheme cytochrome c family protein
VGAKVLIAAAVAALSLAAVPSAGAQPAAAPLPPGVTAEQVSAGGTLFQSITCGACHGAEGKGGPLGPDLTSGTWIWVDGSLASISDLISKGVPAPKQFRSPMPPMGGETLSPSDLANLSAYVWRIGHK